MYTTIELHIEILLPALLDPGFQKQAKISPTRLRALALAVT